MKTVKVTKKSKAKLKVKRAAFSAVFFEPMKISRFVHKLVKYAEIKESSLGCALDEIELPRWYRWIEMTELSRAGLSVLSEDAYFRGQVRNHERVKEELLNKLAVAVWDEIRRCYSNARSVAGGLNTLFAHDCFSREATEYTCGFIDWDSRKDQEAGR
jgi:hypothetical protein